MYNILVADDSALMRKVMCDIINSIQNFSATDVCADGETAYKHISGKRYDAATINMVMSRMPGEDILQRLRQDGNRTPVVGISSEPSGAREVARKAFELGVKDFVYRPFRMSKEERDIFEKKLVQALLYAVGDSKAKGKSYSAKSIATDGKASPAALGGGSMAKKRQQKDYSTLAARSKSVANNVSAGVRKNELTSHGQTTDIRFAKDSGYNGKYSLVAIASSTGGPQALHTLIPMFPANIGVPMVIVQHMPKGFTASLAERINEKARLVVKEAEDGEILKKNHVYIAPGGRHLEIVNASSGQLACKVYDAPPVNNLRPCADVMYESLKKVSCDHILCAVLTGMGADGSAGIKSLKSVKDLYVVTQSEDTCVVYGMPKAADIAGLSNESQPITQMSKAITKKLGV